MTIVRCSRQAVGARELVPHAAHRPDQHAAFPERLAQPEDMHVDGTLFDDGMLAPDPVEQLAPLKHPLRVREKELEQPEFRVPHVDRLAVQRDAEVDRVQGHRPCRQDLMRMFGTPAPQQRADA